MDDASGHTPWIDAGLAELAEGGIDRVRVEVLAARLGVTKGAFYRRFKNRRALLDAVLATWSAGRIGAIERQTALDGETARERLASLLRLYSERINPEGMSIELAIRQWARSDRPAAEAVAQVDAARLASVAQLYRALGMGRDEADAQSFLFYSFVFGQSLLFLGDRPRRRGALVAACAARLTEAAQPKHREGC